jgi:hypothetical protein
LAAVGFTAADMLTTFDDSDFNLAVEAAGES